MSNIYIQEPPTSGKVLLKTTVGDIDIELWSKEAPKACRNFVQLCLEGYYDNTIFHRVVKGFIAQGGDPSGTGMGGESIYGEPFKDEFHSRLKFNRRGLVAMANGGKDDNGSQFFFTLGQTPELHNKHTLFGKVAGKTIYNMIKLEECSVDKNERPLNPHKILKTEILSNPFDDIVPREIKRKDTEDKKTERKSTAAAKKDFKLLSFGDEAEEEEEEINSVAADLRGKSKSSHDLLKNDPKLSSVPVVDATDLKSKRPNDGQNHEDESDKKKKKKKSRIQEKLEEQARKQAEEKEREKEEQIELYDDVDEKEKQAQAKLAEARDEYKKLKKQMIADRKKTDDTVAEKKKPENEAVVKFLEDKEKYFESSSKILKKGSKREDQTLALLEKFKQRIVGEKKKTEDEGETLGPNSTSWMAHKLVMVEDDRPVLAKDANKLGEGDWYDIYDPRNPLNKKHSQN